jgi:hypothetical protein
LKVAEQVERLPSKIVQVSGDGSEDQSMAYVLCEDGSMWVYNHWHSEYRQTNGEYQQIHPPHKPPTHAADLAEAVSLMWNLLFRTSLQGGKYKAASQQARDDARAFLKRMG